MMKKFFALILSLIFCMNIISYGASQLNDVAAKNSEISDETIKLYNGETAGTAISSFSVTFLDVGQGDASLIECDGHYMLIDGGGAQKSDLLYAVMQKNNVPKLDIVVASHADEDHIGGIAGALNFAQAELALCPVTSHDSETFQHFQKYVGLSGTEITVPEIGNTYSLGSATVSILGVNADESSNDSSIVLKVSYGDTAVLFTGDAEAAAEQALLESGSNLSSTILKVAHHGSDSSTSNAFLQAVQPQFAVISVGKDNTYGHPTANVLNRLKDANVSLYRTDLQGDVTFTSDGRNIAISTEKDCDEAAIWEPGSEIIPILSNTVVEGNTENAAASSNITRSANAEIGYSYVLNMNSHKFHVPNCKSVKKMKESNKDFFSGTRDEAIAMGYQPCGNCRP